MFDDPYINKNKWPIKSYEDISYCITDGEHSTPKRCEKGVYLLSARNILNHSLQLKDVDFIDEEEYKRISKRIIPKKNDILISCSGSIGRVCRIPKNIKLQMVRSVAIIRFKENINAVFMEWLIDSNYTQQQILRSVNQSTQANLFQGKIRKLKAIVPPIELQNKFADFVKETDKLKYQKLIISLKVLTNGFNSLIQEMLNSKSCMFGEICLKKDVGRVYNKSIEYSEKMNLLS
ncbi:MAG: restriction endonuclease subunit S [Clostridium sp.]